MAFEGRISTSDMAKESSDRIELLQGTLDMLILRTLLFGPAHGHEIAKHIQRTTEDVLQVEHGSLYPALHRLERKGWVASKWEMAKDRNREFKYYRLTAGREEATYRRGVQVEATGRRDRAGDVAGRGGLRCDGGVRSWDGGPWSSRRRREADIDREVRNHLDLEAEEQQESGLRRDQAQHAAQRAFGNVTLVREDIRGIWKSASLEILLQDLRYALRTLRANPLFTLTAVLSLALGIGANTAIFTLLHVSLWKPLPVTEPHEIFRIKRSNASGEFGSSYVLLRELSEAAGSSGGIFATAAPGVKKFGVDGDSSERVVGQPVSGNFFSALRLEPALGRVLESRDDSVLGGNHVAVLSHAFWVRRFQSSPEVLGKTIQYKETPYTVVGVARTGFSGLDPQMPIDIWVPVTADADVAWLTKAPQAWLSLFMRLPPGSTRHGCKVSWTQSSGHMCSRRFCRVCQGFFDGNSKANA